MKREAFTDAERIKIIRLHIYEKRTMKSLAEELRFLLVRLAGGLLGIRIKMNSIR